MRARLATIRDRILEYLRNCPEGATDAELRAALGIAYHSQVNTCCRALAADGLILRQAEHGAIRNYPATRTDGARFVPPTPPPAALPSADEPWYWEGHVQSTVVRHLAADGYDILRVCDTASRERGKDIEARSAGRPLWVTVKGYPEGTPQTRPQTQAPHWFSGAVFDIICWRGEDAEVELALALPDFPRYRNLAQRVSWLKSAARFCFLWVGQDANVQIER